MFRIFVRLMAISLTVMSASIGPTVAQDASDIVQIWEDVCLENAAEPDKLELVAMEGNWRPVPNNVLPTPSTPDSAVLGAWVNAMTPYPILLTSVRSTAEGQTQNKCVLSGEVDNPGHLQTVIEAAFAIKLRTIAGSSVQNRIDYQLLTFQGRKLVLTLIRSKQPEDRFFELAAAYRAE